MKKYVLIIAILLLFVAVSGSDPPMTDSEMKDIMKTSDNWRSFNAELNSYITAEGIGAWDFHDQVNAFLQEDVGPQSETEAFDWWSTDGWYQESQIDWVWPWGLWYIKYTEKWNGAQWA